MKAARVEHHLPVANLDLPGRLTVGRATFRQRGWLASHIAARRGTGRGAVPGLLFDLVTKEVGSLDCATVSVVAASVEEARPQARDAVAVVRLYQRARYPRIPLDEQTFGLAADVVSRREDYWATTRKRLVGGGGRWHGVLATWSFTKDDVKAFDADPRFAFLQAALIATNPNEVQRRALLAVQVRDSARVTLPPSLRIIDAAVALEALVGDEKSRDKAHRIARRLAYLGCGQPDSRCGRHRLACFYLASKSTDDVMKGIATWNAAGHPGICSEYWRTRELFDDRNHAVHEGRAFSEDEARDRVYQADQHLLSFLDWAAQLHPTARSKGIEALDAEVATAVANGVMPPPAAPG